MSRWFLSATFVICVGDFHRNFMVSWFVTVCVHDFPHGEVWVKVGIMEFGLIDGLTVLTGVWLTAEEMHISATCWPSFVVCYLHQGGNIFARLCLSVCQQGNSKSYGWIFLKFWGYVGHGTSSQWFNFGGDPEGILDSGSLWNVRYHCFQWGIRETAAKPKMVVPPSEQHCLGRGVQALPAF